MYTYACKLAEVLISTCFNTEEKNDFLSLGIYPSFLVEIFIIKIKILLL